jgi:hypothetical protein
MDQQLVMRNLPLVARLKEDRPTAKCTWMDFARNNLRVKTTERKRS